jgi:tRNA threonylcarbamoyladenosine biosynthesis protein TsaE
MLSFTTANEDETRALGQRLGALLRGGCVVLLDGDLGAGKTRFSQGVAQALGAHDALTSPTFNLVLEYPLEQMKAQAPSPCFTASSLLFPDPRLLRHFDLYRLEQPEQLDDLDYFALIEEPDAVSLVEWGSKFKDYLPLDYILARITVGEDAPEQRILELSAVGICSLEVLARFAGAEGEEKLQALRPLQETAL